jgi:hypothetical protein
MISGGGRGRIGWLHPKGVTSFKENRDNFYLIDVMMYFIVICIVLNKFAFFLMKTKLI